jgi:hypothetical protein
VAVRRVRELVIDDGYLVNALVEVWDGWRDPGEGIYPHCGRHPVLALVEVADDAQGAVMHSINGPGQSAPRIRWVCTRKNVTERRCGGAAAAAAWSRRSDGGATSNVRIVATTTEPAHRAEQFSIRKAAIEKAVIRPPKERAAHWCFKGQQGDGVDDGGRCGRVAAKRDAECATRGRHANYHAN